MFCIGHMEIIIICIATKRIYFIFGECRMFCCSFTSSLSPQSRCTFLHTLYQRMITGQVYINLPDSCFISSLSPQSRCTFLHTLYQRMITGQVYINLPDSCFISSLSPQSRCTFLHTLYQRMITGQVYINSPDSVLSKYSWADMSSLVAEQVAAQLSEVHRANERVRLSWYGRDKWRDVYTD